MRVQRGPTSPDDVREEVERREPAEAERERPGPPDPRFPGSEGGYDRADDQQREPDGHEPDRPETHQRARRRPVEVTVIAGITNLLLSRPFRYCSVPHEVQTPPFG